MVTLEAWTQPMDPLGLTGSSTWYQPGTWMTTRKAWVWPASLWPWILVVAGPTVGEAETGTEEEAASATCEEDGIGLGSGGGGGGVGLGGGVGVGDGGGVACTAATRWAAG